MGDLQALNGLWSSRHRNVEPGAVEVNRKVAESCLWLIFALRISESGNSITDFVASIVKLRLAGVGSVLCDSSVARTSKTWGPLAREL